MVTIYRTESSVLALAYGIRREFSSRLLIVGGYTDYLSAADVAYIDEEMARTGFDFRRFDD